MKASRWPTARALALALVVVLLSPVSPLVLVFVPLAILLLSYRSTSFFALFLAALLLAFTFSVAPTPPPTLWYAERAWALIIGGGFVLAGLLGERRGLMARSVAALAIAAAVVGLVGLLKPAAIAELDWWMSARIGRASLTARQWLEGGRLGIEGAETAIERIVNLQILLYPAFLALASLAALGVAWFVTARLSGRVEVLAPLREFRFSDHLVWLLVVGLALFLLPAGQLADRLGENAMAFMGGLYALRGAAILIWVAAAMVTSAWGAALWSLVAILLYPLVLGIALLMGLSDTWLDLRGRLRQRPPPG